MKQIQSLACQLTLWEFLAFSTRKKTKAVCECAILGFLRTQEFLTYLNSLAIQAPVAIPPVHPRDKNLLRPLSELGKPKYAPGGYSFLRRTEYISSEQSRPRLDPGPSKVPSKSTPKFRKPTDTAKDEPINVLRAVVKGFDIANPDDAYAGPDTKDNIRGNVPSPAELEAWKTPRHPTKPELKLVDSYPIMPDLDALTDSLSYMVAKFTANPTQSTDVRDIRMDAGLLQPLDLAPDVEAEWKAKLAAYEADSLHNPNPGGPPYSYSLFLPADEATANNMLMKLDVDNPEKDDPALCIRKDKSGLGTHRLNNIRTYETGRQTGTSAHPFREVALALHDPEFEERMKAAGINGIHPTAGRLKKAAYYYPVVQKTQLKPRRNKNLAQLGLARQVAEAEEDDKVDVIDITIRDPDETESARRASHRMDLDNVSGGDIE